MAETTLPSPPPGPRRNHGRAAAPPRALVLALRLAVLVFLVGGWEPVCASA